MSDDHNDIPDDPQDVGSPPNDELDTLLKAWHQQNVERAAAGRERLMQTIAREDDPTGAEGHNPGEVTVPAAGDGTRTSGPAARRWRMIRRLVMNRYSPIAACLIVAAALIPLLMPPAIQQSQSAAYASDIIMAPEAGRLDALDDQGNIIGPCPLKHTDVDVEITGRFVRLTLTQKYKNPYDDKIEAVYTFPLSHRAAVDRMTMIVGDRIVEGEVHERQRARAIYQAARDQGYVASLLEQERPNIFTQSVANIEPNAEIDITISYVELLDSKDGTYSFEFPMVVGPRYTPGSPKTTPGQVPAGLAARRGVIRLGPAKLTVGDAGNTDELGTLETGKLTALLHAATSIDRPDEKWWESQAKPTDDVPATTQPAGDAPATTQPAAEAKGPKLWYKFEAAYCNGSRERGTLHTDGTGQLNGRWFHTDPAVAKNMGTGFSPDTTEVPDASRVTPQPVPPGHRAGHDISVEVTIDTGGPGIIGIDSALHQILRADKVKRPDGRPSKVQVALKKEVEIPNRDFVLTWRQTADTIEEATFTHTGDLGNYFTLILMPPERVEDNQAVARELVFVLDVSGSMRGFPIEKAKEVMAKAIDALRPQDTFNLITFSGNTSILWDKPRPFTEANRAEAQQFLASRQGGGGTEMMKAINAALVQAPPPETKWLSVDELLDLPADGRSVRVRGTLESLEQRRVDPLTRSAGTDKSEPMYDFLARIAQRTRYQPPFTRFLEGRWVTENGERVLVYDAASFSPSDEVRPIRVCCFMTDGKVSNDMAIIDAVKKNAHTTRVFSFGIGNSVNRYLLDGMAREGRGEVEYVLLANDADEAAKRFAKRIQTPVLTDIELDFSDGLEVADRIPKTIPDLFDVKPLILHGKYTNPGKGTLTIRGNTGSGPYERTVDLDLPESQPDHDVIATLWARAQVEELMNQDLTGVQRGTLSGELKQEIVRLGERYRIMTQFTSFVAVEKTRITVGGKPRLVAVPIEMPHGVSYEGIFGKPGHRTDVFAEDDTAALLARLTPPTITIPVNHADPKVVAEMLSEMMRHEPLRRGPSLEGEGIRVEATDTGAVVITGSAADKETLARVQQLVALADRPAQAGPVRDSREALLEAKMAKTPKKATAANDQIIAFPAGRVPALGDVPVLGALYRQTDKGSGSRSRGRGATFDYSVATDNLGSGMWMGVMGMGGMGRTGGMGMGMGGMGMGGMGMGRQATQLGLDLGFEKGATVGTDFQLSRYAGAEVSERGRVDHAARGFGHQTITDSYLTPDGDANVVSGMGVGYAQFRGSIPFLQERAALAIARLVADGKTDDARKLAHALAAFNPDFEIGVKMRDLLADESLEPAERDKQIAELADQAKARIEKEIDARIREAELHRRLDPRLHALVIDENADADKLGITVTDAGVRVAVLTSQLDDVTRAALEQA